MSWIILNCMMLFWVGFFLSLGSSGWLMVWVGMEVMMVGMYSLFYWNSENYFSESGLKYFIVQSFAGMIMLPMGYMLFQMNGLILAGGMGLLIGLVSKLGLFPFHGWVMSVMSGMGWFQLLFLLGFSKIPPLWVLGNSVYYGDELFMMVVLSIAIMSMMVGALLGVNTKNVRLMMGASSINHSGWMSLSCVVGGLSTYLGCYLLTLGSCLFFLHNKNSIMTMWSLMSLSGLPPFTLFWGKLSVLVSLGQSFWFGCILVVIIVSSLYSLFYYLNFCFVFGLNMKNEMSKYNTMWLVIMNLMGLMWVL